jgi:hypothetical protein
MARCARTCARKRLRCTGLRSLRAVRSRQERSAAKRPRSVVGGPAGQHLGRQHGCSPSSRPPLAQADAADERERERQMCSAWLAAFIKDFPEPVHARFRARAAAAALSFPERHVSSFAARTLATALAVPEGRAGGSSGGAFPLSLPLNLPAATSTPLFAFFSEACPRLCQSAPA